MNMIPELLAPAGNLSCAVTAIDSGADAVYAGLSSFNAREGADNFSFDDLSRLAEYAKERDRRYYITLNTLLKESELDSAIRLVSQIERLEPDALIMQDIGAISAVREIFPHIAVHASTQMGFHNLAGVKIAQDMGISRVILERQLDIEEIAAIAAASPLEIELFIHGALCCSLSGMCLFSSWMGGWSGNRGRCKQPCRRRFHSLDRREKESGFFFSTRDLYALDLIPRYRDMGIASLKIEGRLKKEAYVEQVVRAYRLMLDAPPGEEERYLGEARRILARSFGRHWSHGFSTAEDRASVVYPASPGISGLLVGEVVAVRGKQITARISRRVHRGDRLRLQDASGGQASAFTLTEMRIGRRPVAKADASSTVTITLPVETTAGMKIYKVGESRRGGHSNVDALPLFRASQPVDLFILLEEKGLSIRSCGRQWRYQTDFKPAKNRPIDEDILRDLFRATRDERYRLGNLEADIRGSFFLPPGELKQLRRAFWSFIIDALESEPGKTPDDPGARACERLCAFRAKAISSYTSRECAGPPKSGRRLVPFREAKKEDEAFLPFFVPEGHVASFTASIREAMERAVRFFRVTSLFHVPLLQQAAELAGIDACDLFLTSSWPLPASNTLSALVLARLGVRLVQSWPELDAEAFRLFSSASPVPLEHFAEGRVPLLVTRAILPLSGAIVDGRGGEFHVAAGGEEGLTVLWSGEEFQTTLSSSNGVIFKGDLLPGYGNPGRQSDGEQLFSHFNEDREWK
ncbi:peptidase U32 family protein [Sediminispirochaeta smaragdinae]|nr:U32 family peptidase [Sediminispirochaeta smaragdinae]